MPLKLWAVYLSNFYHFLRDEVIAVYGSYLWLLQSGQAELCSGTSLPCLLLGNPPEAICPCLLIFFVVVVASSVPVQFGRHGL